MEKKVIVVNDSTYKRLKNVWYGIKQRCKPIPQNINYGFRGITMCKEWSESFDNFVFWAIENSYRQYHSIDRINVNGNYEPNNCRWSTASEQSQNKRHPKEWNSKYKKLYGLHSWEIAEKLNKRKEYIYSKHKRGELKDLLKENNLC